MFYSAQAMRLTKNISSSSHKGVISTFGIHFVKTGVFPREMGRELNRAFEKRQIGDYTFNFVITRADISQRQEFLRKYCSVLGRTENDLKQDGFRYLICRAQS
jgi:uncharacterized protein (UPF0332 family)